MTRRAYVFYEKEVKQVLTSLFFDAMSIFGERFGDDVPISDLTGRLHEDFFAVLNELFEERVMEVLVGDVDEETIDPAVKQLVERIREKTDIPANYIEQIDLVTKNGLFIVEITQ